MLDEQRLAGDRTEAFHDARALAIEFARGEPSVRFDPMTAGVVLQPGETVYRQLPIWIRVQDDGRWSEPSLIALAYSFEQATHVRVPPQFLVTIGAASTHHAHAAPAKGGASTPDRFARWGLSLR
jgi:hypothetical protein